MADRTYAPPKASEPTYPSRRNKDDLHEWSIYRQNLTSTIADGYLAPPVGLLPGAMPSPASEMSARQGWAGSRSNLPYGEFQMHDNAVQSVVNQGRQEDLMLGDKADTYLRFGLPRVAVQNSGKFGLQKPGDQLLGSRQRRAQSELDLSRPPGLSMSSRAYGASVEQGLDRVHHSPAGASSHYERSEATSHRPYDHDRRSHTNGYAQHTASGAFMHSKRHHAHYFSNLELHADSGAYNYLRYAKADDALTETANTPHLQLRDVAFERDTRSAVDRALLRSPAYRRVLDGVSLDVFGGQTVALLHTSEEEAKTLLTLLADAAALKGRVEGSFVLNGLPVRASALTDRIAYVTDDELYPNLTVKQHLHMTSALVKPATDAFRTKHMLSQLIETLALAPFDNRLIGDLGRTEKQRVKLACQILADTDMLLLDNIICDMDLYDSAFLVDYLRDWATKLGRIVIMAVNPPTFEILTMFYQTAVLASGRLVYFGKSLDMIKYFESLDYPCPTFKNPCDYYVDLVTHDHLTMEASVESTERIRRLADIWTQKAPPLAAAPPAAALPPRRRSANPCSTVFSLALRFCYLFVNLPWEYCREVVYCLLLSLLLGVVFLNLTTRHQAGINDRFGLIYLLLTAFLMPNLWLNIERINSERSLIYTDIKRRIYGHTTFFISKVLFDFPLAIIAYLFYVVPVYFLSQLQSVDNDRGLEIFATFVGACMLHCIAWRYISWLFAYAVKRKLLAATLLGGCMALSALGTGVTLNPADMWSGARWLRYASPTRWTTQTVARNEFLGNATTAASEYTTELLFGCLPKTISNTYSGDGPKVDIVTVEPCAKATGAQAFAFAAVAAEPFELADVGATALSLAVVAVYAVVALLLNCCLVYCGHAPKKRFRHRQ